MRCDACDRRWDAPARFCGRCGARLGGRDTRPDRDREVRHPDTGSRLLGPWVAVAALALAALAAVAVVRDADVGRADRPVARATVTIPSAGGSGATTGVRAADRAPRPVDCSEHLQDLPRPVRRSGLHVGTLTWRDGRLCAVVDQPRRDPAPPRCDPPWVLACVIP